MNRILLLTLLAALVIPRGRTAEPLRLQVSPDRRSWSVERRVGRAWVPMLSGARVSAVLADGAQVELGDAVRAADGRSVTFRAADLTVKIIARWLPAGRLPSTVTLLPIAFAGRQGVVLRELSVAREAAVPDLGPPTVMLVNGYASGSPSMVRPLNADDTAVSWWVTVLKGIRGSLLAGYASSVVGRNSMDVRQAGGRAVLTDRSDYGALPVPADGNGVTLDALYLEAGKSPTEMLARYAVATRVFTSIVDPARKVTLGPPPTVWRVSPSAGESFTEDRVLAEADTVTRALGSGSLRVFQVGSGYQAAIGDWDAGPGFPHGHRWLTDRIHDKGLKAGLWLAPMLADEGSGLHRDRPDWFLKRPDGSPFRVEGFPAQGPGALVLDVTIPAVRAWLAETLRKAVYEWGYDFVELAGLGAPLDSGAAPAGDLPPVPAYRAAMKGIRAACGLKAYTLADDAPIGPTIGLADAVTVTSGGTPDAGAARACAREAAARQWMNGTWWRNYPGPISLEASVPADRLRAWAALVSLSGGLAMVADSATGLTEEQASLARSVLQLAPAVRSKTEEKKPDARAADLWSGSADSPSVWLLPSARSAAGLTVVAYLNWGETPRTIRLNASALGVPSKGGRVHAWDVISADYLGSTSTSLTVAPEACRVVAVVRALAHPQVIGLDTHLTAGAGDLTGVSWVARYRALRLRVRATPGRPFLIALTEPAGYAFQVLQSGSSSVERLPSARGSVLLRVTPRTPDVRLVARHG